jgi:excisionase family DNA binding protein
VEHEEEPTYAPPLDDELLVVPEVATWLRLNPTMVEDLISQGKLRATWVEHSGRRSVRIPRAEIYRYLGVERRSDKPLEEVLVDALRSKDTGEVVNALRGLAASAERLADALDSAG